MIVTTERGESFDTAKDLSAPERHILQKLFIWHDLASSLDEFRKKKEEALHKGWGDSGSIMESSAMKSILRDLEQKVTLRLMAKKKQD